MSFNSERRCKGIKKTGEKQYAADSNRFGREVEDQAALANYVRDYLDDRDAAPTKALDEYVGRCIGKGEPIIWEDAM